MKVGIWLGILLAGSFAVCGAGESPWYRDYFTMVTAPHALPEASVKMVGADAFRASTMFGGWYGAWYPDWQGTTGFYENSKARCERLFRRSVLYYDGGEIGDFAAFLGPNGQIASDGWRLQTWKGAPPLTMHWFGLDSFFRDENPFPFKNYKSYGLKPFTDPAGKVPASVYEVLGRWGVDGQLQWNESGSNAKITDEQAQKSGLAAVSKKLAGGEHVQGRNGWVTVRLMTQDYANPQLRDYQAWELARMTREFKPDGWHIDNLGDNNLYRPFLHGMGTWSEFTFRQFMKRNFTPQKLAEIGIADIDTFDIKQYLRDRRNTAMPNLYRAYDDAKWKDDLVFKCYLINHVQESVKFHAAKYDAIKRAAAEDQRDVMVSGNLIPIFAGYSLLNGKIDVAHFEWQAVREYQPTRRPTGLPPTARSGYITRLATAVSRENYSVISLYVSHDLRGEEHENLYLAQGFEALANRSILDFGHAYLDMYSPGTPKTAGILSRFVQKHREALGRRDFVADVGVVYDQWADVASSTACQLDVTDFFNEYAGWCDFLSDTHRPWKVLLSTDLQLDKLKQTPVIVLPSAMTLSDANFATLKAYLEQGGRVVATGRTGQRFGPEGFLMKRPANPLEAFKVFPGFRWVMDQPGSPYWLTKDGAAARKLAALATWPGLQPTLTTDAEIHVGVTLSRSLPGQPKSLSLDLNNNHFDVKTDRFTATSPLRITIRVPEEFEPPLSITVAEPEQEDRPLEASSISFDPSSRQLSLTIKPFEYYQLLQIRGKT